MVNLTFTVISCYILTSGLSFLFCNGFFVLFHLYQRKKLHAQQSNNNDDFLLSCIGLTIQLGNLHSTIVLYILITGWNNQFLTCFLFNFRAVNSQIQLVSMLFFSLTRFAHHFFPQQFFRMNHHLIGSLIKFCIVLVPAYLNFIIGHTCGIDVFCPKDFRKSFDLITYSDSSVYQEELQTLLLKNLECRIKMFKVVLPIFVLTTLLPNLLILMKELSCVLQPCQTTQPPESVELSTMYPDQSIEETQQQNNNNSAEDYSVGRLSGVFTILIIILNMILILLPIYQSADKLKFLPVEMVTSILIPMIWSVDNTDIIKTSLRAS